ncbi:MAG TPA: helix-turn-helix transcriptional regulator [Bacteroidia bacterium]|nr:helix-turn-helix transcriptional regulator [Bacteroidia bacterium]
MKSSKSKRIPKILRINDIDKKNLRVSVLFSNGEDRILDFRKILNDIWKIKKTDFEFKLLNPIEFAKVKVANYSLSWDNIEVNLTGSDNKKIKVPYQVGADTLFELSEVDTSLNISIGELFKKARLKANKSQEQVAESAGTSRTYITRLENNKQDVEIMTLKKLIEAGLNKHLRISID